MPLKSPKQKGYRIEKVIERMLNELNHVWAKRVPLSGALKNFSKKLGGDIKATILGREFEIEVKSRRNTHGFGKMIGWLDQSDILVVKEDARSPWVFMPWEVFAAIVEGTDDDDEQAA